jgi:type VI protein secretion system component Hcp
MHRPHRRIVTQGVAVTVTMSVRKLGVSAAVVALTGVALVTQSSPARIGATHSPARTATLHQALLAAYSADNIYVNVSGFLGGENSANDYPNSGFVDAVSSEVSANSSWNSAGGGASVGKAVFAPIVLSRPIDSFTTQFATALATGHKIRLVKIHFSKNYGANQTFDAVTYALTDVLVKSDKLRLDNGGTETVTLLARQLKITYTVQGDGGGPEKSFVFCWNVGTNTAC